MIPRRYQSISVVLLGVVLSGVLLLTAVPVGSAEEQYSDDFDAALSGSWVEEEGGWTVSGGAVQGSGSRAALIFDEWKGTRYVLSTRFAANDSQASDYMQEGFYFYYEDDENYARVVFKDNDRADKSDQLKIESDGVSFRNEKKHIDVSGNSTFEFSPDSWKSVKVVRLGREVWVYYEGDLAYSAEFRDGNPEGRVGFDAYASTGYFDDFELRPVELEGASLYRDRVALDAGGSWALDDGSRLRVEEVSNGSALVSLTRLGKAVDSTVVDAGDDRTLRDGSGRPYVAFRAAEVFDTGAGGRVWLEEVVARRSGGAALELRNVSVPTRVGEGGGVEYSAALVNTGDAGVQGRLRHGFSLAGERANASRRVSLAPGGSVEVSGSVPAPDRFGTYRADLSLELLDRRLGATEEVRVVTGDPPLRDLDVERAGDLRVRVEAEPRPPGDLVDWHLPYTVRVTRLAGDREEVYADEGVLTAPSRVIDLSAAPVRDGFHEVSVSAGGAAASVVVGSGTPRPTPASDPAPGPPGGAALVLALLGLVAVNGAKTWVHGHRSLPLEATLLGGGAAALAAALLGGSAPWAGGAMLVAGVAVGVARFLEPRVAAAFTDHRVMDDYGSLLAAFAAALVVGVQAGAAAALLAPVVYGVAVSAWIRVIEA